MTGVEGGEAEHTRAHGKHARRSAGPTAPTPTASATPTPAAAESNKAASLPADWDERLGRSPAAAPASPSSPKHAGTLSVDDL